MKNENYITIQGWMRNEFDLRGNELLVYALVHGFSQDGETKYTGSIGYIADWIGSSRQTVHNVLRSLIDKGLIHKDEQVLNGVKFCQYTTTNDGQILQGVKKFDGGVSKNLTGGCQKILHNNIVNNDNNNIYKDVPEPIKEIFMEWADMRKSIKKPIKSKGTVTRALNKLNDLSQDIVEQRKIIEMAIDRNWLGFYPLNDKKPVKSAFSAPEPPKYRTFEPDPEIETSQMPEEIRQKYMGWTNGL